VSVIIYTLTVIKLRVNRMTTLNEHLRHILSIQDQRMKVFELLDRYLLAMHCLHVSNRIFLPYFSFISLYRSFKLFMDNADHDHSSTIKESTKTFKELSAQLTFLTALLNEYQEDFDKQDARYLLFMISHSFQSS